MDRLTVEQWSIIFDALEYRKIDLEGALEEYPHAEEFIQGKIDQLDEILEIVGPLSV